MSSSAKAPVGQQQIETAIGPARTTVVEITAAGSSKPVAVVILLPNMIRAAQQLWQDRLLDGDVETFATWLDSALQHDGLSSELPGRKDLLSFTGLVAHWCDEIGADNVIVVAPDIAELNTRREVQEILRARGYSGLDEVLNGALSTPLLTAEGVSVVRAVNELLHDQVTGRAAHYARNADYAGVASLWTTDPRTTTTVETPPWAVEQIAAAVLVQKQKCRQLGAHLVGDFSKLTDFVPPQHEISSNHVSIETARMIVAATLKSGHERIVEQRHVIKQRRRKIEKLGPALVPMSMFARTLWNRMRGRLSRSKSTK